jgi:hypothetical protein
MNRRTAGLIGCLLLLTLATGCATKYEGGFNPTFFPRAALAPEARQVGRVAVWVRRPAADLVYTVTTRQEALGLQVPIGRIVEEAALASVGQTLQGGALLVNEVPVADGGFAATLVIDAVRMELDHEKYTAVLPLPPFITWVGATSGRVAFDLRLLDAQGRAVWSRTYDSGREDWQRFSVTSGEEVRVAIVRIAHETAWRLSQQVAADVRDWLADERGKPREL